MGGGERAKNLEAQTEKAELVKGRLKREFKAMGRAEACPRPDWWGDAGERGNRGACWQMKGCLARGRRGHIPAAQRKGGKKSLGRRAMKTFGRHLEILIWRRRKWGICRTSDAKFGKKGRDFNPESLKVCHKRCISRQQTTFLEGK